MTVKKAIYKVDNGSGFDEMYFKTTDEMVTLSNGSNLKEEFKKIPRFNKPNFTFTLKLMPNKTYEIKHNLGYRPILFSFSTTIGNVNPTFDVGDTIIRMYNYVGAPNECWVHGYIW